MPSLTLGFRTLLSFTMLTALLACEQPRREDPEEERRVAGDRNEEPGDGTGGFNIPGFGDEEPEGAAPGEGEGPGADPAPPPPSTGDDVAASQACTPQNNCRVIEETPTCDAGYIFSVESPSDLSCRLPTRLETQRSLLTCEGAEVARVFLYDGVYLGFEEGQEEYTFAGLYRQTADNGLRFMPVEDDVFVDGATFSADAHTFWTGMTDTLSAPLFGNCQLNASLSTTPEGQWLWEDDFCSQGYCTFTDNTFTTNAEGTVLWHVSEDISTPGYSDTITWTRQGRARIEADGFVNFTFPAFDGKDATQFVGAIDSDGNIFDGVREVSLLLQ